MGIYLTRRLFIAGALTSAATGAQAQARQYDLTESGSRIAFIFTSGGTEQTGTVPVNTADIRVDTTRLARSQAEVTADIRDVSAGLIFVTQAIKSPELLDAATHPIVRFRSRRIVLGRAGRISEGARIEGDLTLRGITLPLTLDAQLNRPPGTAPDDLSVLFIQLNGTLSRTAFGVTGYPGLADDEVKLDIRAELRAHA